MDIEAMLKELGEGWNVDIRYHGDRWEVGVVQRGHRPGRTDVRYWYAGQSLKQIVQCAWAGERPAWSEVL